MHAILISGDNMEKIEKYVPKGSEDHETVTFCLQRKSDWYALRDYVTRDGIFHRNAVMPGFVMETSFIIDVEAAAKDWDTVYRLA